MILMNDFKRQWKEIGAKAVEAFERVGASGWYVLGKEVSDFENQLANKLKFKGTVGVANGMDALEISLRALGLKAGDKVLTTPISAFPTTLAILRAGGVPVFVDVDALGLIDLEAVEQALVSNPEIKFLVPVHLYGFCLDLEKLESLKNRFGLKIVEDCAQSVLAAWNNKPCGSVGQLAATSFYPTKNLGCLGDGGAIFGNDQQLLGHVKVLRDYGQSKKYQHTEIGLNSRLDEVQAAILSHAIVPHLETWTARRAQIAAYYLDNIKNENIQLLTPGQKMSPVWHLFPVRVPSNRAGLEAFAKENQVQTGIHYPIAIHQQEALSSVPSIEIGSLKKSLSWADEQLSIPIHPMLSDAEVETVVNVINRWES